MLRRVVLWWRGLATGPRWALTVLGWLLLMTVVYVPVAFGVGVLFDDQRWWERLPQYLAIGAAVSLTVWWRERGQTIGAGVRRDALQRGELPPGTDPEEWRQALLRDRRRTRQGRQVGLVAWGVLALGWLLLVLLVDLGPAGWIVLVFVVASGAVPSWVNRRQLRRIDVLLGRVPD